MARDKKTKRVTAQPDSKHDDRRLKPELWFSIFNLLLTTFIALYLNNRNEKFQEQFFELQNKAELANMTLSYENGVLSAYNLGPATAQDLRFVICISSIDLKWDNAIHDVSDFVISIDNPALESNMQTKVVDCNSEITDANTVQITVKSLSPQQSVEITIKPSIDIPVSNAAREYNIYVRNPKSNPVNNSTIATPTKGSSGHQSTDSFSESTFLASPLNTALDNYLKNDEFKIADIELSMACTNCNLDQKKFVLSSFMSKEISQIETSNYADEQKIHLKISSLFYLPDNINPDKKQDLYLISEVNNNGEIIIVESTKFEFIAPTPIPPTSTIVPTSPPTETPTRIPSPTSTSTPEVELLSVKYLSSGARCQIDVLVNVSGNDVVGSFHVWNSSLDPTGYIYPPTTLKIGMNWISRSDLNNMLYLDVNHPRYNESDIWFEFNGVQSNRLTGLKCP